MKDQTREWVTSVKNSTATPTAKTLVIYQRLLSDEALWSKAAFHHKATRKERRRINDLWKLSMKLGGMNAEQERRPEARELGGLHRSGGNQGSSDNLNSLSQESEPTS